MQLAAVPLDIREASGIWRFADGRLTLSQTGFRLSDRAVENINKVGFLLIIALMLYANGMDIFRAFFGK